MDWGGEKLEDRRPFRIFATGNEIKSQHGLVAVAKKRVDMRIVLL